MTTKAIEWRLYYAGDPDDTRYCEVRNWLPVVDDCVQPARWYAENKQGDTFNLCNDHKEQIRSEGLAR